MIPCLPWLDGKLLKSTVLSLSWIPSLLRNEKENRIVLSHRDKGKKRETLTFRKANIPTDVYWPTITSRVQETSWNSTIFVVQERIFDDMNVTSTKLLCRDWKSMNLDCVPPAESRPLCSSSSLFLQNGLRHHADMCWTFTQTTVLMPTCSRQTLVKDHAFLVKPAYYLKSLYGVRGFCVCDISVV